MSKRALIIEDEEDIAQVMYDRLESWGFETTVALNGKDGLNCVERIWPDLVLLDIRLPDQDGLDLLRQIRQKSVAMPIIIVSASHGSNLQEEAMAAGATDFILKPYEPNELKRKIAAALRQVEE